MKTKPKFKQTDIRKSPKSAMTGEDWPEVMLGDVASEITVGHVGRMVSEYVQKGIPFLRSQNVDYLRINTDDIKFITPVFHERLKKSSLSPGDVVIVRTGKPGTCAIIPDWLPVANCSDLVIVRCGDNLDAHFLAYFVNSVASHHVTAHLVGAVQQHFNVGSARAMRLKLPPIWEQRIISKIFSDLDSKIELNQNMNKIFEEIGKAIFKQWFVDFEFPNEEGKPYKFSGGEMVYNKELGKEMPKGWKVGSIYEISEIVYGAPFSSKMFNKEKKGLPLIRIRDLKNSDPEFYTTEQHPKRTEIFAGDIIAGMDAEFRPHIWLGEKSYLNQRLCYFKPKNNIHRYFVLITIKPILNFFENAKVGTTVIHLGKSDIDSWRVIIPTDKVNEKFSIIIDSIFNQIVNNSMESRTLIKIRDILLPKLMSGKIRVPIQVK